MKVLRFLLLLLVVAFLSCKSTRQSQIENLIGEVINIPRKLPSFKGGDFKAIFIPDTLKKYDGGFLYYFGNDECQSCIINKIPSWADDLAEDFPNLPIICVFSSELSQTNLPVSSKLAPNVSFVLDTMDQFLEWNEFVPEEPLLRMYALDSDGKIIVCGNVAGNDSLKDLLRKHIKQSSLH